MYEFILNAYNINLRNYPDVDKFLYHADGKTLKQRIDRWIEEYNKFRNKSLLYYRISLITKHGHRYLDENLNLKLVIETGAFDYVTIDAGCEASCEDCRDHHGTYRVYENIMLPPYHPDCDCVYWFHNAPNPDDEPEDEKYEPEPVDDEWKPEQEGY